MRLLFAGALLAGTPAFAHHEVVVASSMIPAMTGLAFVVMSGFVGMRQRLRAKRGKMPK